MTAKRYRVTRDVPDNDPHNWLGRDAKAGEEFDEFTGPSYGCDSEARSLGNVLLENPAHSTFFEFPGDAVEVAPPVPVCGGGYFNGVTAVPWIDADGRVTLHIDQDPPVPDALDMEPEDG
jgi:hypothetical protein